MTSRAILWKAVPVKGVLSKRKISITRSAQEFHGYDIAHPLRTNSGFCSFTEKCFLWQPYFRCKGYPRALVTGSSLELWNISRNESFFHFFRIFLFTEKKRKLTLFFVRVCVLLHRDINTNISSLKYRSVLWVKISILHEYQTASPTKTLDKY